jgi:hypothetical protein
MGESHSGRMSIVPSRAVDDRRFKKHPQVFLILSALGTYSDRDGWCWPSVTTLAERTEVSRSAIQRALQLLVDWEYLSKRPRVRPNQSSTTNAYKIRFDDVAPPAFLRVYDEDATDAPEGPVGEIEGHVNERCKLVPAGPKSAKVQNVSVMAHCLTTICQMNYQLNSGQLLKLASELSKTGYSVDDIQRIYGAGGIWWAADFRGKKGEYPKPSSIRSTISEYSTQDTLPGIQEVKGDVTHGWFEG